VNVVDIRRLESASEHIVTSGQGYFPVIAATQIDDLLVVMRGGSGHMGLGGRLDAVRSADGGRTWTQPTTIADSERDDRNPALGFTADGVAILGYHWQGSYDDQGQWEPKRGPTNTRVIRSADGGVTWGEDLELNWLPLNGTSPFGKIRCDAEGTLYMPVYSGSHPLGVGVGTQKVDPATCPTYLLRSNDGGDTWRDPLTVAVGLNEADLLIISPNDWLFAGRSENREEQAIYTLRSNDRGHTWSQPERVTDGKEHPPDLTLLSNGVVLMTYGRRHPSFGVEARISLDRGRTWQENTIILASGLPGTDIGYPSTARLSDGTLVTVYYRAGTKETPNDGYNALDVSCIAVRYSESDLLTAIR
jgi:hypothetical protein